MSQESITALFHNQKDFYPDKEQNFNQLYVSQSPELNLEYDSEKAEIQFQPILEVIDQNFTSIKDLKILEIGGSSGILSKKLQEKGATVTMLEVEPSFVNKAKQRGINAQLYNGIDMSSVIRQQLFDIIIANRVFEEIVMSEYQIKKSLIQARQHLRKDGLLITGTQNPDAVRENIFTITGFKKETISQTPFHQYITQVSTYRK